MYKICLSNNMNHKDIPLFNPRAQSQSTGIPIRIPGAKIVESKYNNKASSSFFSRNYKAKPFKNNLIQIQPHYSINEEKDLIENDLVNVFSSMKIESNRKIPSILPIEPERNESYITPFVKTNNLMISLLPHQIEGMNDHFVEGTMI